MRISSGVAPCLAPGPLMLPALAPRPAGRRLQRRGVLRRVAAPEKPVTSSTPDAPSGNGRPVFIDRDGQAIKVMCCDYGFRTGSGRIYQDKYGEVPGNVVEMAVANFNQELDALRRSFRYDEYEDIQPPNNMFAKAIGVLGGALVSGLSSVDKALEEAKFLPELKPPEVPPEVQDANGHLSAECKKMRKTVAKLKLNDQVVWAHEEQRKKRDGDVNAPWFIRGSFWLLCVVLDVFFANRPIQRFWVLETVARIPYFAYISILHLYESVGFWRAGAELRRIHFAEEWNELHHLQIMESLGGDQKWFDRFIAEHAALLYYWVLIFFYLASPRLAYMFSELVELHAADTYAVFVEENQEVLQTLPPPRVAAAYYRNEDLYMFDELQTCSHLSEPRRPACNTLYDVFVNIRDDEVEHVKTMHACQDTTIAKDLAAKRRKQLGQ